MATVLGKRGKRAPKVAMRARAHGSARWKWFWEVDRVLLLLVAILIAIGLVAVAAASPAAAARDHLPPLSYFFKQLGFVALGVPIMVFVSMQPRALLRRLCLVGAGLFFVLLLLTPLLGAEVNGARRWLGFGILRFQPSEFLKPLFTVAIAWMLSFRAMDRTLPVVPLSFGALGLVVAVLMAQPDLGQTIVFAATWFLLLLLAGVSARWMTALALGAVAALGAAYLFYENGRHRIDAFLGLSHEAVDGPTHVELAYRTINHGGFVGVGPGAGTAKFSLPEAHNDYVFSVIGEEFGLVACAVVAILYLAIVVRVFVRLLDEDDGFTLLAAAGLATQFGLQAFMNIAVNVGLAPSKGMTLPFISYGGSSVIAISVGFGLLLAFTRRNPYLATLRYTVKWKSQ